MKTIDSLKPNDSVTVTIAAPDGSRLYQSTDSGFHNLEAAVSAALDKANLEINPEDCIFTVTNDTTGASHRYRFNAHGNLKLILEP